MADGVFNISKGKVAELWERVEADDPANSAIIVVLLSTAESDSALQDYDDLAAILAGSSVEATATNYARAVLTDSDLSSAVSVDDANDRMDVTLPQITFTAIGGVTNNTIVKVLLCYDSDTTGGTDSSIIPLTHHDISYTTTGVDLQINSGVVFRAS